MIIDACGATHRGKIRRQNEDNIYVEGRFRKDLSKDNFLIRGKQDSDKGTYAVFDGLGGEACGEQASFIASSRLRAAEERDMNIDVDAFVAVTQRAILERAREKDARNMGTTAVALCIDGKRATVFNVGDSRAYLFRSGVLTQLSKDHSVIQSMIDAGFEEAAEKNRDQHEGSLTQYLGMTSEEDIDPEAYVNTAKVMPGDIFMLCSDGLVTEMSDDEIRETIYSEKDKSAEFIMGRLLKSAVDGKGRDNVSVIVCKIV